MKEKLERRSNAGLQSLTQRCALYGCGGGGTIAMWRVPMSLRPITKVSCHRNGRDVIFQVATIGVHPVRPRSRVSLAKGCVKNARMPNPSHVRSEPVGQTKDDAILQGCNFDGRAAPRTGGPLRSIWGHRCRTRTGMSRSRKGELSVSVTPVPLSIPLLFADPLSISISIPVTFQIQ